MAESLFSITLAHASLASFGHQYLYFVLVDAHHGFAQVFAQLCQYFGVVVVGHGLYDGLCAFFGIAALEDAAAYEYSLSAQLHHQCRVGRRRHTAGSEVHHRQLAVVVYKAYKVVGDSQLFGCLVQARAKAESKPNTFFMTRNRYFLFADFLADLEDLYSLLKEYGVAAVSTPLFLLGALSISNVMSAPFTSSE